MKFFIKDFFSKCDQIRSFLGVWSRLLKKSLMKNCIFCAVTSFPNLTQGFYLYRMIVQGKYLSLPYLSI